MVQESTLIQLWLFALILLVVTPMNRREGMENESEDMENESEDTGCPNNRKGDGSITRVTYGDDDVKGLGKAVAKVMRTGMYEGIYNVHSDACYALTTFKQKFLDSANQFINGAVSCSSTTELTEYITEFEGNLEQGLIALDTFSDKYNMDAGPLKKLLNKYKKLIITRLKKGELPEKAYLEKELDEFTAEFCKGRPTDKSVGIAAQFIGMITRGREEEEYEDEVEGEEREEREE